MDDPIALLDGGRKVLGSKSRALAMPQEDMMAPVAQVQARDAFALLPRATATTTATPSSSTCGPNDNTGICEKPVSSSTYTLPIILGIGIPLVGAIVVFLILHRRHVRKQRREDEMDPHKSMDFGLGSPSLGKDSRKAKAAMANADIDMEEKTGSRSRRQRSLDLEIVSPYLLPPELQSSRESLHSLSRTIHQQEDPYRPISQFVGSDTQSMRSFGRRPLGDGASVYSGSSNAASRFHDRGSSEFARNAAGMPRSAGFNSHRNSLTPLSPLAGPGDKPAEVLDRTPRGSGSNWPVVPQLQVPPPVHRKFGNNGSSVNSGSGSEKDSLSAGQMDGARESYMGNEHAAMRKSNNYLGAFIHARDPSAASVASAPPAKSIEPEIASQRLQEQKSIQMSPPLSKSSSANLQPQQNDLVPKVEPSALQPQLTRAVSWSRESAKDFCVAPEPQSHHSQLDGQQDHMPSGHPSDHSILDQDQSQRTDIALNETPSQQKEGRPQLPQLVTQQEAWNAGDRGDYANSVEVATPSTTDENARSHRHSVSVAPEEFAQAGLGAPGFDPRRISMGLRPLPPSATVEHDDPEIRANRIRSFYKEYFDESKPAPQGQYYEDYDQQYLGGDTAYYDPNQNNFVMPYAQPVARRAMTPPPQSQRFMGPPPRAFHGSMGGYGRPMMPPGQRAVSSASGRFNQGPAGPRPSSAASSNMSQRRPMPPPAALSTLPTPSKLRDDSFALMNSIEFAPPPSYKERQRGRSQSPLGERRPYSPSVPPYKPLASTYDELPSIPSPHQLRKSGTFSGLDFAPPRRIRDNDNASDAGSIRSNRSGMSAMSHRVIQNGGYRVSRLPGDTIFMKDDIANALKPSWKVGH